MAKSIYDEEFEDWWKTQAKTLPKDLRAVAKRWAKKGWFGYVAYEQKQDADFKAMVEADRAKGIDVTSPNYWGDFA